MPRARSWGPSLASWREWVRSGPKPGCRSSRRWRSPCRRRPGRCACAWDPFIRHQHLIGADRPAKGVRTFTKARLGPTMVSEYVSYRPPTSVGMTMVSGPWFFGSFGGGWRFVPEERDGVAGTRATWKYTYSVRPGVAAVRCGAHRAVAPRPGDPAADRGVREGLFGPGGAGGGQGRAVTWAGGDLASVLTDQTDRKSPPPSSTRPRGPGGGRGNRWPAPAAGSPPGWRARRARPAPSGRRGRARSRRPRSR